MTKFVSYYRCSTRMQKTSGLGLEAQEAIAKRHVAQARGELIASFKETESGMKADRVELRKAIDTCKKHGATLLISTLSRLSRDPAFLFTLQESGLDFVCADMPQADRFTIGIMIVMALKEREDCSIRTRLALQAKKERGERLGNPNIREVSKAGLKARKRKAKAYVQKLQPVIREIQTKGMVTTLHGIADVLNRRGYKTPRGKEFKPVQVKRVIDQLLVA